MGNIGIEMNTMQKIELNKYIVILSKVNKILTGRGFKRIDKISYSLPKLFASQYDAKQYLIDSTFELNVISDCEFVKVRLTIEK